MKKITTATIGIPAHNEAQNIATLLHSILSQKISNKYQLKQIVVVCDGCSDDTPDIAKKISKLDQRIIVLNDGKRYGQIGRLNRFYKSVKEDIFITFDADTRLGNEHVVDDLLKPFDDKQVVLVGGNDTPDIPSNLIQKIGASWVSSWYLMRYKLNEGDTVHNHKGCVSAGRMSFLKTITIPPTIYSNDDFLYFLSKVRGGKFKFVESAIVYYTLPSNLEEYLTQSTRFLNLKHRISNYFGDWVYELYKVPLKNKIKGLVVSIINNPLYLSISILLQVVLRLFPNRYKEDYMGISWKIMKSTKTRRVDYV